MFRMSVRSIPRSFGLIEEEAGMNVKEFVVHWFNKWMDTPSAMQAPQAAEAAFRLVYRNMTVGILEVKNGRWRFQYSDEFRKMGRDLRPIVEFSDTSKVYESDQLWPFFRMRIPSLKQSAVKEAMKSERIEATDEIRLLRRFGRKTISNPYELVPEGS